MKKPKCQFNFEFSGPASALVAKLRSKIEGAGGDDRESEGSAARVASCYRRIGHVILHHARAIPRRAS